MKLTGEVRRTSSPAAPWDSNNIFSQNVSLYVPPTPNALPPLLPPSASTTLPAKTRQLYVGVIPEPSARARFLSMFSIIYWEECYHICSKLIAKVISNVNKGGKHCDDLHFRMRYIEQWQGHGTVGAASLVEENWWTSKMLALAAWNANLS